MGDPRCGCGHLKSQHSVVEMGGSTRGIECCVDPETGEPECGCMAPEYDPAHEVAEALEARLPEGVVVGEDERSVIREVLA